MNIALGESGLLLAFLGAVGGAVVLSAGMARNRASMLRAGESYIWLVVAGAVIATFAMQRALITHDFTLAYVASNDSTFTPLVYRVTAMWSDLSGSVLLWALMLSGYLAFMWLRYRRRSQEPLVLWAKVTGYVIAAFFFGLMLAVSNPFDRVHGAVPTQGPGPNPLLQDRLLVAFHPPMLYLGLVGFTVPFCLAVGGLVTGQTKEPWLQEGRRWAIFSWACLTAGLVLGAWWSYQVLGWGGYWSWDPVENSALLPWLTGTAFIHSAMVQSNRGMLRVWNLSLLLATFGLTILGTFFTRSGVLDSVHDFTNDGGVGPALLAFFAVTVAICTGLLIWRGDELHVPGSLQSAISREGAFLANNLLFAAFAFVVLLGTVFPLIVQALNGPSLTVGAPFFDTMTMPIVLCLLFLMAVAPVLPWQRASGQLLRQRLAWPAAASALTLVICVAGGLRGFWPLLVFTLAAFAGGSALRQLWLLTRRSGPFALAGRSGGGMVVHLGVVVIAVAFAASHAYQHQAQLLLDVGKPTVYQGQTLVYRGMRTVESSGRAVVEAVVDVDGHEYFPGVEEFALSNESVPSPAVRSTPALDVYLTLADSPAKATAPAAIDVTTEPMVIWLWVGGAVVFLGALMSLAPSRRAGVGRPRAAEDGATVPIEVDEPLNLTGAELEPVAAEAASGSASRT
ncbi:MAG TPA: cytochrome c-type biogenesis CcmF C-terminal domain-containing protein [Acidimicrobiales bacterium]|nr:cytochrome c-type biogenesis CcmF C-terminal domain-containing protein [Acidimicrobiales bacterium]